MVPILIGVGAFLSLFVMCALFLFLATVFSVVVSKKLEYYLVITDRWTFWIWIVTLAVSPGLAFWSNWVVWGMFLPPEHYGLVRWGWLTGGILLAVAIVVFLLSSSVESAEDASDVPMCLGALLIDVTFCCGLIWYFDVIANFMNGLR